MDLLFPLSVTVLLFCALLPRLFLRLVARAALAALMIFASVPVLAIAAESAPETIAQAAGEMTKITWAWGAMLSQALQAIAWLLVSIGLFFARQLPANIVAILGNARVETLLTNAINYGVNAVIDATHDKTMSVEVGNKVLAQALQYALDNAPVWLQKWAGGPEGIAKKIWGRLDLGEGASAVALASVVAKVKAGL